MLRYLPAPEITSELFVSVNTIRTHTRHIYAKLDAHSRVEAVARASARSPRWLGACPIERGHTRDARKGRHEQRLQRLPETCVVREMQHWPTLAGPDIRAGGGPPVRLFQL